MENLNAFLGYFLSYLIVFLVFVALVVIACIVGVRWRKAKEAREISGAAESGGTAAD
ncbi:hypothetical protein V1224_08095 [Lachnospiraceae bacterium JLR.KK008]